MKRIAYLSLLIALLLTGCSTQQPTEITGTPDDRGTAVPLSSLSTETGPAAIEGSLWVLLDGSPAPVENKLLYLAKILTDSNGELRMASMDRATSPRSVTGPDGTFAFPEQPAGAYGLVLDVISQTVLLADPDTGEALIIEFQPGQHVDLGKLIYDELPTITTPVPVP